MVQALTMTPVQERIFSFIGDGGAVTPEQLVAFLGVDDLAADAWLRSQMEAGCLFRDEFGAHSASCPWPRIGF